MQYLVFDTNLTQRWRRVKEFVNSCTDAHFWIDIKKHMRYLIKELIQITMDEEMVDYTNAKKHQRTDNRLDYRNGYYYRNLDTELGHIDELKVPRSRLSLFKTKVFDYYQRRQKAVNETICKAFINSISTRNVCNTLKPILETTFSASTVSGVTKSLEVKVKEFHKRKLLDEYQFLFLDGIVLKVKNSLKSCKKLVLVAYGITIFGKKELISFRIASSESQTSAVKCIEKDLDELLNFLEIPLPEKYKKLIRRRIRTTNVIERAFREIRRRTRPISCFTNEDSVNRIIYAVITRLNNNWADTPLKEFTQFI